MSRKRSRDDMTDTPVIEEAKEILKGLELRLADVRKAGNHLSLEENNVMVTQLRECYDLLDQGKIPKRRKSLTGESVEEVAEAIEAVQEKVDSIQTNSDGSEQGSAESAEEKDVEQETDKQEVFETDDRGNYTEIYWPRLREILQAVPTARHHLNLRCEICLEEMTTYDGEHNLHQISTGDEVPHEAAIMPCGHMVGRSCLVEVALSNKNGDDYQCPFCRHSLCHQACQHVIPSFGVPLDDEEEPPLSIPEGGKIPLRCSACILSYAVDGLNQVAEALRPSDPQALEEGWKVGIRFTKGYDILDQCREFEDEGVCLITPAREITPEEAPVLNHIFRKTAMAIRERFGWAWLHGCDDIATVKFQPMFYKEDRNPQGVGYVRLSDVF